MKLGLLGDIHGNVRALQAVLDAAVSLKVEKLLITGDLVGYYFSPLEVMNLLAPWSKYIVRGNHEEMLQAARNNDAYLEEIDKRYGSGLRTALAELGEKELDELCSLVHPMRIEIENCRILLCHGAPWNVEQYVYPDATPALLERCSMEQADLIVLGHTHYPMRRRLDKAMLVNPGAVGQPRKGKPGAYWALFDTDTRELSMRCERYDVTPVIEASRRIHPDIPYLAEVLERT